MAAFACLTASAAERGALPVSQRVIAEKSKIIEIKIAYPHTDDARIDSDLLATVNKIADGFSKEAIAAHDAKDPPYTLAVTCTIARNDAKMFDVVFNDEWDFRGAHPNTELVTANYFRDGGWRIYLPELFDGGRALARISTLATADLDRQLLGPDSYSDKDWIARGADAHWDNFQAFVLLKDTLEIEFPPYAVAAYAAGPQKAHVALAKLSDVMRANPRAPVASFDCTRAASQDERAICSDVGLARLDRELDETWSSELRNENDPQKKAHLKSDQVAWLSKRAGVCKPAGLVACLTGYYRARLAALEDAE